MRKQCSTRGATGGRKSPGSGRAAGAGSGRGGNENPSTDKDITKYARVARKQLRESWPEIVAALVTKARSGRYHETKLLLDLCELSHEDENQRKDEKQWQLCDALMDGLELRPVESANDSTGKDNAGLSTPVAEGDLRSR